MSNGSTPLHFPSTTGFPVTVGELLAGPGQRVSQHQPLFGYTFEAVVTEDDEDGVEQRVKKRFPGQFESPVSGLLRQWKVKPGDVLHSEEDEILRVEEACRHEVQFGGMCAQCGVDLTVKDYTGYSGSSRAQINMAHDTAGLTVSMDEAHRLEKETTSRLLKEKKLSLVVDLDQTIIHAVVDPTVGQWKDDPSNPNYPALQDVHKFQIHERGFINEDWYFIKPRPGLQEFLAGISRVYECHIYTMGTRNYAREIAKMTDPDGSIFGDRILSRDESGSMNFKSLKRLFPVDTSMVVIIDDRADVWQWSQNLIKVKPFEFFPDIGDINSSFLPKRRELSVPVEPKQVENATSEPKEPDSELSTIDQLIAVTGGDDANLLAEQTTQQEAALEAQKADRPLAKQQEALEASEKDDSTKDGEVSDTMDEHDHRPILMESTDTELVLIETLLMRIHKEFYAEHPRSRTKGHHRKVAALKGSAKPSLGPLLQADVKPIIGSIRSEVLAGTVILFSGVVPVGMEWKSNDLVIQAQMYGATVLEDIREGLTHLVAPKKGTEKIWQALQLGGVQFVKPSWLIQSVAKWKRQPEDEHALDVDAAEYRARNGLDSEKRGVEEGGDSADERARLRTGVEWDEANREVDEFLAELSEESEDNESEAGSVSSAASAPQRVKLKRDREERGAASASLHASEKDNQHEAGSPLAKRLRVARLRHSSLRHSSHVSEGDGGSSDVDDFASELQAAMG